MLNLYTYAKSSAAYRVRIALNLKALPYSMIPVNLLDGAHRSPGYLARNPEGLVPALESDLGMLSQSLAILEWLEETHPKPALLPADGWHKAQVRSVMYAIACDIHPINNLRVLKYLTSTLGVKEKDKTTWYQHWITTGFTAIEQKIVAAPFCFGEKPTLADVVLIPQVFNALRFETPLGDFPKIRAVWDHANTLEPFVVSRPENQVG